MVFCKLYDKDTSYGYCYIDITNYWKNLTGLIHVKKVIAIIDYFFDESSYLLSKKEFSNKEIKLDKNYINSELYSLFVFVDEKHSFQIASSEWLTVYKLN